MLESMTRDGQGEPLPSAAAYGKNRGFEEIAMLSSDADEEYKRGWGLSRVERGRVDELLFLGCKEERWRQREGRVAVVIL